MIKGCRICTVVLLVLGLLFSPFTGSLAGESAATGKPVVYFGIIPRSNPMIMYRNYQPIMDYLSEMTLTTNGLLLAENASRLKAVGVRRVNVSLDSLDPQVYALITRGGDLARVLAGLQSAEQAGVLLKLNMVVMCGINDHEVESFAALSRQHPWSVRFIEYMPTIREAGWRNRVIPGREILQRLQQAFVLSSLATSRLCGPAKPYRIDGAMGTLGIITPMSDHFCGDCNRIRATARGLARSCLLSDQAIDLKPALAQDITAVRKVLMEVIGGKHQQHHFGDEEFSFQMSGIGG